MLSRLVSAARGKLTPEVIKEQKYEIRSKWVDAKMQHKAEIQSWNQDVRNYLPACWSKQSGQTNQHKQEMILKGLFPESNTKMDSEEEKDSLEYKKALKMLVTEKDWKTLTSSCPKFAHYSTFPVLPK
jgi:hypothetical protein